MNDNKALKRAGIVKALRDFANIYEHNCITGYKEIRDAADLLEQDAAPNDPLTLTELRGMDGEPVRIEENGEYQYGLVSLSGCAFTPKDEVITLCNGDFYLLAEMEGNYKVYPIAYRRKSAPEEGEQHV